MNKIAFILLIQCTLAFANHGVVYEFSGGRFGDNLLCYLHAKWIAFQYDMTLYYKTFPNSNQLKLDDIETKYSMQAHQNRMRVRIGQHPIEEHSDRAFLYICPYFPEDPRERKIDNYVYFDVDWKNEAFRKIAFNIISPKKNLTLIIPPKDTINIAIHVRRGDNYDTGEFHRRFGLKLPPLDFYVEGLKKVLEFFPGKSIYCYIFTDAQYPQSLEEMFKQCVPLGTQIRFGFRRGQMRQNMYVLEDFFSLFNFDILIRPQSNFSMIPSLLKDFAVVYHPVDFSLDQNIVNITEVNLELNQKVYDQLINSKG